MLEIIEGQTCTVFPFNDSYLPMKEVQIVNAAFAVNSLDGTVYILKLNQCLDFRKTMHHSLLCTKKARANGTIINDIPPEYDLTSNDQEFTITFPKEDVTLALSNRGPIPHLNVRYPTDHDIDNCPHLDLTDSVQEWDPYKGEVSKLNMESNFDHKFNSNFCESFDYTLINFGY